MRSALIVCALGILACGEPPPRPRAAPADKASLYGDPGLVPTREGERARRELALAGQVHAAVLRLHGVSNAHVDVALAEPGPASSRVTVTVVGETDHRERIDALARGIVGPVPAPEVRIIQAPAGDEPRRRLDLPLGLALLALGTSLGVTLERYRRARG